MTPKPRSALSHVVQIFDAKSVKIGLSVAVLSLFSILIWVGLSRPPLCPLLSHVNTIANTHHVIAYAILTTWSFCLFLTILPLGTTTIFIAGFFLGPLAGIAQYCALLASSMLLFHISKDTSDLQLKTRLSAWPALTKWSNLARKHGFVFSAILRIVPVVPSAAASLAAAYFHISRRDFYTGTIITGWIRPVAFATLGAMGKFAPICGLNIPLT